MDSVVIFRRSRAIDAPEYPNDVGLRFVLLNARRQRASPTGSGDGVSLRACAGCPLSRNLKHSGPSIQHWKKEVTVLHIRDAQYPRLSANVDERRRIECVSVRCGHVT